jgi:hypothetical protein
MAHAINDVPNTYGLGEVQFTLRCISSLLFSAVHPARPLPPILPRLVLSSLFWIRSNPEYELNVSDCALQKMFGQVHRGPRLGRPHCSRGAANKIESVSGSRTDTVSDGPVQGCVAESIDIREMAGLHQPFAFRNLSSTKRLASVSIEPDLRLQGQCSVLSPLNFSGAPPPAAMVARSSFAQADFAPKSVVGYRQAC